MSFFHPPGMFANIQICLRLCRMLRMLKAVYLPALMAYASISSGPSAFLLLIAVIALLVSVLDCLLQSTGWLYVWRSFW